MMHPSHQRFGVEVFIPEKNDGPACPHGPMLLFERYFESRPPRRFYSCSASRDHKECSFFQWEDEKVSETSQKVHKQIIDASRPRISHTKCWKRLKTVQSLKESDRIYCHSCDQLVLQKEKWEHKGHELLAGVSDNLLSHPSRLLKPWDNKKSYAQYLFSNASVDFLMETFRRLGYKKILCIGTPRIHEAIQAMKSAEMDSILLDLDHRYAIFNDDKHFLHYNMFNHHFFNKDLSLSLLRNFFQNIDSTLVILDPPFGGLVQVLAASLQKIWKLGCPDQKSDGELPTFWIFPYFMGNHISEELPSFNMCEFQVDYDNHPLYKKPHSNASAKASPVRIFTNIPLKDIVLPLDHGYRYCEKCERYVSKNNKHCEMCRDCTSKDGRVWVHCSLCNKCVKKSRVHCQSCNRCDLVEHNCERFIRGCHVCGQLEHKRNDCPNRSKFSEKRKAKREKRGKAKQRRTMVEK